MVFLEDKFYQVKLKLKIFVIPILLLNVHSQQLQVIIIPFDTRDLKTFFLKINLDEKYVAIVSGLNLGAKNSNTLFVQMFVDFITGQLGSAEVPIYYFFFFSRIRLSNPITNLGRRIRI